jgi:N-acetylglutamate synthase-like GNAT family acetyltransferase
MNTKITLRLAQDQEIESIIDLQTLALLNPHSDFRKYSTKQVDALVKGQAQMRRLCSQYSQLETIVVAEDYNRDLAGFACLSNFNKINGVYVHPDFMRRGIGAQLLTEIERIVINRKIKTIWVLSSIEATDFYRKNGYAIQRNNGFYKGLEWIPCQLMKKELLPLTQSEKNIKEMINIISFIAFIAIVQKYILRK